MVLVARASSTRSLYHRAEVATKGYRRPGAADHEEPEDLYEIIRQCYEHGSTILTSNRAIEEGADSGT